MLQQQLTGIRTVDVHATHHLVFRASGPILGIPLGAKGLDRGRSTALTDERFPGIQWGLADDGHGVFRFVSVPNDQGTLKGDSVTYCFYWWAH